MSLPTLMVTQRGMVTQDRNVLYTGHLAYEWVIPT